MIDSSTATLSATICMQSYPNPSNVSGTQRSPGSEFNRIYCNMISFCIFTINADFVQFPFVGIPFQSVVHPRLKDDISRLIQFLFLIKQTSLMKPSMLTCRYDSITPNSRITISCTLTSTFPSLAGGGNCINEFIPYLRSASERTL